MRTETIIFDGKAYHRYPDSKSQTLRDYYRHHPAKSVVLFLHREVWKRCHGRAIPKGYHVSITKTKTLATMRLRTLNYCLTRTT